MPEIENPPAFPFVLPDEIGGYQVVEPGMTLRDWFAAHAPAPPITWWGSDVMTCAGYAQWNYQYADVMLAARKAKP